MTSPKVADSNPHLADEFQSLLADVKKITSLIQDSNWKNSISKGGDKIDAVVSRVIFEIAQANEHLLKTRKLLELKS